MKQKHFTIWHFSKRNPRQFGLDLSLRNPQKNHRRRQLLLQKETQQLKIKFKEKNMRENLFALFTKNACRKYKYLIYSSVDHSLTSQPRPEVQALVAWRALSIVLASGSSVLNKYYSKLFSRPNENSRKLFLINLRRTKRFSWKILLGANSARSSSPSSIVCSPFWMVNGYGF